MIWVWWTIDWRCFFGTDMLILRIPREKSWTCSWLKWSDVGDVSYFVWTASNETPGNVGVFRHTLSKSPRVDGTWIPGYPEFMRWTEAVCVLASMLKSRPRCVTVVSTGMKGKKSDKFQEVSPRMVSEEIVEQVCVPEKKTNTRHDIEYPTKLWHDQSSLEWTCRLLAFTKPS